VIGDLDKGQARNHCSGLIGFPLTGWKNNVIVFLASSSDQYSRQMEMTMLRRKYFLSILLIFALVGISLGAAGTTRAASLVVTITEDTNDGICDIDCSLREAVDVAGVGDEINFDSSLANATITLSSPITIDKNLTITGASLYPGKISISGGDLVRIFYINSGLTVTLDTISLIDGYTADVSGAGAIYIEPSAILNIVFGTFSGHNAINFGGAIINVGTLNITESTFTDNQGSSGGAIYSNGTMTISRSTFDNNTAGNGSAIYDFGSSDVFNSTFYNNTVTGTSPSGAYVASGVSTSITNCTFSENSATSSKIGGLFKQSTTSLDLKNTIIANSAALFDCYAVGSLASDVNNIIENNDECGTPLLSSDPGLDILRENYIPRPATVALLPGSPAIDAGDNSVCADPGSVNNFDQRGRPRPIDADLDGTPVCDIGAQEAEVRYVAPTGTDSSDCLNSGSPCATVGKGLTNARPGDVLSIAAGTYFEGSELYIGGIKPIDIVGAGMDNTFLDGSGSHHVIWMNGNEARISDLTVQNGYASSGDGGAGIYVNGHLTLQRIRIDNNTAIIPGAGIIVKDYLKMVDSIVSNNDATGSAVDGGGRISVKVKVIIVHQPGVGYWSHGGFGIVQG